MKKYFTAAFILLGSLVYAQDFFNYQAVIRDGSGNILMSSSVDLRFSILQSSSTGTVAYSESHAISTNAFGLVNLEIGSGTVLTGSFSGIQWGNYDHFLKVEVNIGSGYVTMGTTQFNYVPYAFYAKSAENVTNDNDNQTLSISGQNLTISGGNSVTLPNGSGTGDITAVTAGTGLTGGGTSGAVTLNAQTGTALWNANKLQGKTISSSSPSNGEVLKWSGSNWVPNSDDDGQTLSISGQTLSISGGNSISLPAGGTGDITAVTAGTGLTGGGTSGAVTLNAQSSSAIWNANELRGNTVSSTTPSSGQVLKWSGTAWAPAADAGSTYYMGNGLTLSGSTIHSTWTSSGTNIYSNNTGNVGIGTSYPTSTLHVYCATGEDPLRIQVAGITKLMVHDNGGVGVGYGASIPPADGLLVGGDVAIGVTTPQSRVHVSSATSTSESSVRFTRSTSGITSSDGFWIGYSSNSLNYIWGYENNDLSIGTNDNFRMTIESDGDVGIGTASPSYDLQLAYNSAAKPTSSAWTVVSDSRLKNEVGTFTDGLDLVMKIRPIQFRYNGEIGLPTDEVGVGTMAQELQQIAPYMVKSFAYNEGSTAGPEEAVETSGETKEYLAVDYGAMDFVLVNAVQELKKLIDAQTVLIEELEQKIELLENENATK